MRSPLEFVKSILGLDRWARAYSNGGSFGVGEGNVFDSVWAIGGVEVTAQALASLPLKFVDTQTGVEILRPTLEQKQLMRLMYNPDPMISTVQLFEMTSMIYYIEGICYWVLMDSEGRPIQSALQTPERIVAYGPKKIKPRTRVDNSDMVVGWELQESGYTRQLQMFQVVRFWKTNPASYLNGLKLSDKIGDTLALDRGAKTVNRGFFKRGARPSGVLQANKDMTRDDLRDFGQLFSESFGSAENSNKIPILPKHMSYTPHGDAKDMDFKNLYGVNRDEIFGGTRAPKHNL